MSHIFSIIFYQPILNLLVFLYNVIPGHDIGLSIIFLTLIIRFVFLPLSKKSITSQKALQDLQPKVEEIKKQYADNQQEMGKAMMKLYSDNKINPLSSCLPILIQLPFLWAVFMVFRDGLSNGSLDLVYSFINRPEVINPVSFGFLDLAVPNRTLAVLAGLAQFWQAKMTITKKPPIKDKGSRDEGMAAAMNKQMLYFFPILTVVFGFSLPGGLTLYWLVSTVVTVFQQKIIFKSHKLEPAIKNVSDSGEQKKTIEGETVK